MFRWFSLAILLTCLSISAFCRRRAHRASGKIERRQEGRRFVLLRGVVTLPLLVAVVLTLAYPPWMAWAVVPFPEWLRWLGVGLGVLTVPAVYWVFAAIGSNISETVLTKADHHLVTHGPYSWVRHPLYTTGIALLLAIGLMAASWFILLFAGIALVLILTVVVPAEERQLIEKFGESYRRYREGTGRLLPPLKVLR